MYRNTRRSSFIAGPALYAGFLTTVIWTPFCQLENFHGPLETGIELRNISFMSLPLMMWEGQTPLETTLSQSAYCFLKTTVTFLPLPRVTLLMSS